MGNPTPRGGSFFLTPPLPRVSTLLSLRDMGVDTSPFRRYVTDGETVPRVWDLCRKTNSPLISETSFGSFFFNYGFRSSTSFLLRSRHHANTETTQKKKITTTSLLYITGLAVTERRRSTEVADPSTDWTPLRFPPITQ